ncbi:class I SAM-dependent methyltransferase [Parvularcula sp. LCG005]|uniref:class I SAM-dependent methyltransferase n=1 Tax=Parvularcula sp. LCG005 TaxID=3078805 RepID=UPI002942141A|nr:class I SAM-dependent methyltransferase [Parvularcula sp. LCG005]WOI52151.1 class I SAM-dependent methyltransferase [Parvularcula sp. LCG005]
MTADPANGYDAAAEAFISARSHIGKALVTEWVAGLNDNAAVLDIGAGHGVLTEIIAASGRPVWAIEPSPRLCEAFRARLPDIPIACEKAEDSAFFDRKFDGITAIGVIFLLPPATQRAVLLRSAQVLRPGGQLLFSAPVQACEWTDVLTGQVSQSLGRDAYQAILRKAGLDLRGIREDEGGSSYYLAARDGA